jgi:hypothetical protein
MSFSARTMSSSIQSEMARARARSVAARSRSSRSTKAEPARLAQRDPPPSPSTVAFLGRAPRSVRGPPAEAPPCWQERGIRSAGRRTSCRAAQVRTQLPSSMPPPRHPRPHANANGRAPAPPRDAGELPWSGRIGSSRRGSIADKRGAVCRWQVTEPGSLWQSQRATSALLWAKAPVALHPCGPSRSQSATADSTAARGELAWLR